MAEIDWIAEAKLIGDYHVSVSFAGRFRVYIERDNREVSFGIGPTEQLAAKDAVLRLRALALRVLPEYAEAVQALREQLGYSMVGEHTAAEWRELLARIDAKEKP